MWGVGWGAWRAAVRSSARIWGGVWRKKRFAVGRMGGGCRADRKEEKNGETRCLRLAMARRLGQVPEGVAMDVCRGAGSASVHGLAVAW